MHTAEFDTFSFYQIRLIKLFKNKIKKQLIKIKIPTHEEKITKMKLQWKWNSLFIYFLEKQFITSKLEANNMSLKTKKLDQDATEIFVSDFEKEQKLWNAMFESYKQHDGKKESSLECVFYSVFPFFFCFRYSSKFCL